MVPRPVATALAAVGAFLLDPAEPAPAVPLTAAAALRPVIAVFGLSGGCGTTVVARALAAELARRDAVGAAAVHSDSAPSGIPLATASASRLANALAHLPGAEARAVGRLCVLATGDRELMVDSARHLAPLVLDAGAGALGGAPAALADDVILVAAPFTEPALADVASDCLARLGHDPVVVLNRAGRPPDAGRWKGRIAHALPDSRMGSQLALSGREPRGELGQAIAKLADRYAGGTR
jgi:hypothetical protein